MKFLKIILMLAIFVCSAVEATLTKDEDLVTKFKDQKIRLVLSRHNEAVNNAMHIVTSNPSPGFGLTPKGLNVAQNTGYALYRQNIQVIYTSPLFRAMQSAYIYGTTLSLHPLKYVVEPRLVVQNFGDLEGVDYDHYQHSFGTIQEMLQGTPPGGESSEALYERMKQVLWEIAQKEEKNVLIVTHAFNYCHAKMLLTGDFGSLPDLGQFEVFDFAK